MHVDPSPLAETSASKAVLFIDFYFFATGIFVSAISKVNDLIAILASTFREITNCAAGKIYVPQSNCNQK
jgi:hypothetical protein